jgi:hypothetical protein
MIPPQLPTLTTNLRPIWQKTSAAQDKSWSVWYGIRAHAEKTACALVGRKSILILGSTFFKRELQKQVEKSATLHSQKLRPSPGLSIIK